MKEKIQLKQDTSLQGGWQFYHITFFAPKPIMEQICLIVENDAKEGKGMFENITTTPLEDVSEDDFAMVEVYDCKASFVLYLDELKQFNIIGRNGDEAFLSANFKKLLLAVLKTLAVYVKEHTDTPAQTKNYILEKVKEFDKIPIWGLFLQILVLQGLCRWMESVNLNEGDEGFNEAQSFYNWLFELTIDKVVRFCYIPFGDKDKDRLRPLCAYLSTTEAGQIVQQRLFGSTDTQTDTPEGKSLPDELDTPKGRDLLQKTIEAGLLDENFNWIANKREWGKYRVSLACYMMLASDYLKLSHKQVNGETQTNWKVFEDFIGFEGKSKSKAGNYIQIQTAKKTLEKSYISIKKTDEWARMNKFFDGLHTSTPQQ